MPKPRASGLETATARRRLEPRKKPYYVTVSPGVALGYRRNAGPGTWSVRRTGDGADWVKRIGLADDLEAADGSHVLNYWKAIDAARALARGRTDDPATVKAPVTVAQAVDRYEADLEARGGATANAQRVRKHLTPSLATKPVMLLDADDLRTWRDGLIAKGMKPATVNRTRGPLRAALELAARLDKRISNRAAYKDGLEGLRGATSARRVVLPDADVLRIVATAEQEESEPEFGALVDVLAQTGCRISQAARLDCEDLQTGAEPRLMLPASYKGRAGAEKGRRKTPVPIPSYLAERLAALRGARAGDAPLLRKADGSRWLTANRSEHWPIFRGIVERAGLDPDLITCYALRHSSICRQLLRGVPIAVVAKTHDTSPDEIQQHYAAYILDVASDALLRRGLLEPNTDNVVNLPVSTRA
jgi:integrase